MRRVLIISYYWPPAGGSGVQRWLKFVKYLRGFGWEPVVYTPENPENPVSDPSLMKDIPPGTEVLRTNIWEPYNLYKRFLGLKKEDKIQTGFLSEKAKPGLSEKLSVWIRGNFFIPDARVFWIKPSVRYLKKYCRTNPVDAVISTGPPHSMHLIAMGLHRSTGIPWLADFRDPWTNIDFYKNLMLTSGSDLRHRKLEKEVVSNATMLITVGETMRKEFEQMGAKRTVTITNGFDEEDLYRGNVSPDHKFSLAHIGSLVPARNPEVLWKALSYLVTEEPGFGNDLLIKLVGKTDIGVVQKIKEYGLAGFVEQEEYMPHDQVIRVQQESQVLLLLINNTRNAKGILTGKFFEYLAARRPILCVGPDDGDAARILRETRSGALIRYDDIEGMKRQLLDYYGQYRQKRLSCDSTGIEKYTRRNLAKTLAGVLNDVAK